MTDETATCPPLLDAIQFGAWHGLIHWLIRQDWAHEAFAADTGKLMAPETVAEFIRWATRTQWGEDDVTPSIQSVLDSLPRMQS